MQRLARILTGVAGMAIVAGGAAPALAQSSAYGQYGYGQYGYGSNGGTVGSVIGQVPGGGRYGVYGEGADRVAVDQCARAAEARGSGYAQGGGYYDQSRGGYGNGYGNPYGGGSARVLGITKVERNANGLRIYGLMTSGLGSPQYGATPYGYGSPGYGQNYPGQGYGQAYPSQNYPNQAYGDPRYGGQGYPGQGYPGQGYGGQPYAGQGYAAPSQTADLSFNCRVDFRGYVSDVNILRNVPRGYGY